MNRTELIEAISADSGLTRQQAEAALDALVYEVTAGVRSGDPVRITGFGTFKLRQRQARRGRNPQTGEAVRIKASKGIGFTPGVKLKEDLNARSAPSRPSPLAATTSRRASATRAAAPTKKAASAPKKAATKKATAKKAPARKTAATKAPATKAPAKKATARKATGATKR